MKILYIANVRFPTPRAHGLQIAKMCEAFARAGEDVTLMVPRLEERYGDPFSYYGMERVFSIRRVSVLNWLTLGFFGYLIRMISFAYGVLMSGASRRSHLIFSRDIVSAYFFSFLCPTVVFEAHDLPRRHLWFWRYALGRMKAVVSTNRWKADKLVKEFRVARQRIVVAPNGFDPKEFEHLLSKEGARRTLNLPENLHIILYTGHLYDWKGAHVLLEAARKKSVTDALFVFVGGTNEDVAHLRKEAEGLNTVHIVGHRPHQEIPCWLVAADVLVLPNSAQSEESVHETSPIKLFEYMAAGRPIVASDLPSIREIVSEREVEFVSPDNPEALARGIMNFINNSVRGESLARAAKEKSVEYSWENRARKILEAI